MAGRFRLERLLHVRERVRQLRQNEAAALAAEVRRLERAREELVAAREQQGRDEARALAGAPLAADDFAIGRRYDRGLAEDAERCVEEHAATSAALVAKREQVTGARQEERKLERIRDAHERRRAEDAARADGRALDEHAIQTHRRKGE
jgi:flagellar export protein FliJ